MDEWLKECPFLGWGGAIFYLFGQNEIRWRYLYSNEKFIGREPNTVGLRATFNSKGAMEKGHPGFPVECETPGYVSITAASSLEDRPTNFAYWPFVRNNLRIAGSF